MARFRNEVGWSSPQARRQADEVMRRMLLDLVRAYQAAGNAALGAYVDHDRPLPVAEQFGPSWRVARPCPIVRRRSRDGLRGYLEHVKVQLQTSVSGHS